MKIHPFCDCSPSPKPTEEARRTDGLVVADDLVLAQMLRDLSSVAWSIAPRAELHGRVKSLASLLDKMRAERIAADQVLDAIGVRVIMPEERECYLLVERIHRLFAFMEGEYKDFVRTPKPNGYCSVHTTIVSPYGRPVEVQVRTPWMHALAEHGPAAHWRYKRQTEIGRSCS